MQVIDDMLEPSSAQGHQMIHRVLAPVYNMASYRKAVGYEPTPNSSVGALTQLRGTRVHQPMNPLWGENSVRGS
jgi:hypothetical protein